MSELTLKYSTLRFFSITMVGYIILTCMTLIDGFSVDGIDTHIVLGFSCLGHILLMCAFLVYIFKKYPHAMSKVN